MDTIALAYPLKNPDKLREVAQHFESGSDLAHGVHRRHREGGVTDVKIFLQHHPQETVIVVVQGEDLKSHLRDRHSMDEIKRLNELIQQASGIDPQVFGTQPPELIHHWTA